MSNKFPEGPQTSVWETLLSQDAKQSNVAKCQWQILQSRKPVLFNLLMVSYVGDLHLNYSYVPAEGAAYLGRY